MGFISRIFYFVLVNILVMFTVSIVTSGICMFLYGQPFPPSGSLIPVIVWSAVWGMGGAFISLFMSKWMAKRSMGLKVIDPKNSSGFERQLVDTVHKLARMAKLKTMPEVAIWDSPQMNAFATGSSKNNSLVAVTTGLARSMNEGELEGVLAHEVAHIANGDMVTMALVQGVVNSFVLFFSRIVSSIIAQNIDSRYRYIAQFGLYMLFQIAFGVLGSIVVCYFSRIREFRADAGGARYGGRNNMIGALRALQNQIEPAVEKGTENIAALQISSGGKGFMNLLRTHPTLDDRIAKLQRGV